MDSGFWDNRLAFLKAIRTGWCNSDYMGFLIERVWKLADPVDIVDFGCGFGYVGLLLMPLLPEGSTYTGIDFSAELLDEARALFADAPYRTRFVRADLNEYEPTGTYGMAVSQAVLRHLPNAGAILAKMAASVAEGGLVVCMENDLELEKAGLYFDGLDYTGLGLTETHRIMYRQEFENGGRDYRIGARIPVLMQEMGLANIGVRMNDSVKFINPKGDPSEQPQQLMALIHAFGWDKPMTPADQEAYARALQGRGLDQDQARSHAAGEASIREYIGGNRNSAFILSVPGTLISYGWKR